MADRSIIICEPLCFLSNMYGKDNENDLKSIFYDFYTSVDIGIAKELLSSELIKLNPSGWVKPAKRRDGSIEQREARVKKEIGDIFLMLSVIHDQQLVDKLPTFVCADVRRLPSPRFESGDLRAMIQRLERLENMMERNKSTPFDSTNLERVLKDCISSAVKTSMETLVKEYDKDNKQSESSMSLSAQQSRLIQDDRHGILYSQGSVGVTDSDGSGAENSSWATQMSRRTKRLRMSPSKLLNNHSAQTNELNSSQLGESRSFSNIVKSNLGPVQSVNTNRNNGASSVHRRTRPKLIGKSTGLLTIKAARDLIKKKYFYVGNLEGSCTTEALQGHLQSLCIPTIKCDLTTSKFKIVQRFMCVSRISM